MTNKRITLALFQIALVLLSCDAWATASDNQIATAIELNKQGRYREALEILDVEASKQPLNLEARAARQNCCIKMWMPERAFDDLIFLRKRQPTNADWPGCMAEAFFEIEQTDRLVACLSDAAKMAPGSKWKDAFSAWQFQSKKDWKNAEKVWNKSLNAHANDAFALLCRATVYEETGRHKEAVKDLTVVKKDREDARPYVLLSLWHANKEQWSDALKVAADLEKVNVTSGLTARASILKRAKNYQEALDTWSQVIKRQPRNPRWRAERGEVYFSLNNRDLAFKDLHYAVNLCFRNDAKKAEMLMNLAKAYARFKEYDKAIGVIAEALKADPDIEAKARFLRAQCYSESGKIPEALSDLSHVIANRPHDQESLAAIGTIYASQKQLDKAEPYYMQAIQAGYVDKDVFQTLFDIYMQKPDERKARIVLTKWQAALPKDYHAYWSAAAFARQKGNFQEAISEFTAALPYHPNPGQVYYDRAECYRRIGRFNDAINDYTKLLSLGKPAADHYVSRAECYKKMGNNDAALKDYTAAVTIDKSEAKLLDRAELLNSMKKHKDALQDAEAALVINPKSFRGLFAKARALAGLGSLAEARKDYTSLILRQPTNAILYKERSVVLEKLGKKDAAEKDADMAKQYTTPYKPPNVKL